MTFPEIEHIDQVLPHVEGRQDFVVKRRPDYTVIDYVFTQKDTFDHPMRKECRGLKFSPDGRLIARPFAKFHNLGETEQTQPHLIDVGEPHVVMDKLDGSMIHPAIVGDRVALMTRMGVTDVAAKAQAYAEAAMPGLLPYCGWMLAEGITPIFEFTAPDNRIVVRYHEPAMTLLALREMRTGRYLKLTPLQAGGIPIVPHGDSITDLASFTEACRALKGAEGYVIRFDDGLMLKLKADDYVLRHRAKDSIGLEKNALAAVLAGADDDLCAALPEEDADALRGYAEAVRAAVNGLEWKVRQALSAACLVDRKTFALEHAPKLAPLLRAAAFVGFQGGDVRATLLEGMRKRAGSGPAVEELRGQVALPRWDDFYRPIRE